MRMPLVRGLVLGVGLAGAALALACSEPAQPVAVAVSPDAVTLAAIGAKQQLTATVTDKDGKTITDAIVSWVSSDKTVATVDSNGNLTAVGSGASIVTASAGSVNGTATVTVDPSHNLAKVGGDQQYGYQGTRLAVEVAVRVRDAQGNGVRRHAVQFITAAGNGTADSAVAFTDTAGVARTGWVMPTIGGSTDTVTLQATALDAGGSPLLGSPAVFTAIAHNVHVTGVAPNPMVEGQSATLTGTGFDAGNTQNVVTVDGVAAAVTGASATQITITVPAYDCRPPRAGPVQVTVGTIPATSVSAPLAATTGPLTLAVGQQVIVTDPAAFCFQFAQTSANETYLVGVQSTSETVTDLTAITLAGAAAAPAAVAPLPAPRFDVQGPATAPMAPARLERWLRFARAEARRRMVDEPLFQQAQGARLAAPPGPTHAPPVGGSLQVGDSIWINFPGKGCSAGDSIHTVVRAKGAYGMFLEDVNNPAKYIDTAYTRLSQLYDAKIYPSDTLEFGTPPDADGNGRVVLVITQEVNKLGGGELGFVTSCDLLTPGPTNASNGGEVTYLVSPDPNGAADASFKYSTIAATRDLPDLMAHESVHIIQFGRRHAAAHPFPDIWLAEGQAVLGEEVAGDTIEHHVPRTTALGFAEASNLDDTTSTDFYGLAFSALGLYFGWDPITSPGSSTHLSNAPWECSWLDQPPFNPGPCVGGADPYGAPWLLLRYLSDRLNGTFAGGEAGLQHALIDSDQNGYMLVQSVTGVRIDSLLAQFGAMMYVDDLVNGAAAELTEATWNLQDVFYGTFAGYHMLTQLRLAPAAVPFGEFSRAANVRAASTYYALLSGAGRPAVAVRARAPAGGTLASNMRYWVVRIQ